MIVHCRNCKKRFEILDGGEWGYKIRPYHKRSAMYFCTWSCIQEYRRKEEARKEARAIAGWKRDPMVTARAMAEIIEKGGDPIAYLESIGYADPGRTYREIKKYIELKDDALFRRLPKRNNGNRKGGGG